jgi:hypothetical protein
MWFIGLVFKKTESLNIDLTQDIQAFTGQGIFLYSLNLYFYRKFYLISRYFS